MSDAIPGRCPVALRVASWCAFVPMVLGLVAFGGWLAVGGRVVDVGPFYLVGIAAIGLGGWRVGARHLAAGE